MAKRASISKQGGVVVVQAPAPRRRSPVRRARRTVRRTARRVSSAYRTAGLKTRMQGSALGGFGVGIVEKTVGDKLPTLPFIGRKGAIALAVYFLEPKTKILQDIGLAAAALAGYEFAKDGVVSGESDWDEDDVFE